MARNTEEANVVVTLNGQTAIDELDKLKKHVQDYRDAAEEAYKAGDKALGDKMAKKAETLEKDFSVATKRVKDFSDAMKSLNSKSLRELTSMSKQLEAKLKKLSPDTKEYVETSKQLQQVNTRIRSLRDGFRAVTQETEKAGFSIKGFADNFNRYFGMATAAVASITGVSMAFRKASEAAAKLDDTYADVMKTTGLLHDEVSDLDKELMKVDTRTSREQLLLLARDAGKLGITGKENILGFVRAADQIQVALGEDLGEGAIRNLGKIADVLGYTKTMGIEQALLSIGSAVNAVGQASTASEAYLVEFTQRMAGVAAQANISAADIIGFASGLDQSAMKVEMAATAFQKFLMKMYEDPAKFAAYANMQVKEFTDLLNNDANTAITTVLKSLKDQDGFAAMVPIFNDMGLDGARAVSVLASMASNLDAVTEAQALANVEFAKATSLSEEYNTKNSSLQAQLEKARKEFQNASIALGQSLNPIMLKSTKGVTYLVKALATYGKEIKAALIAVTAFTAVVKLNTIAHAAYNAVVKVGTALKATWKTVTMGVRLAFYKLIGATEAATIAQAELNAVMSASVFGIIALAVAGLTAAIVHYTKKQGEANEVAKKMEAIQDRINSEYSEGAGKVEALKNIVHNNNIALDERRRALNELKQIVPEYHADLTREGELINDNTDALGRYLENLEKVTRSKILQEEYEQATAAVLKAEKEKADAEAKKMQELINAKGDTTTIRSFTMQSSAGAYNASEITPYGKAVKDLEEKTNALTTAQEIQAEIMGRITKEYGVMQKKAGEGMSEMEKEITGVQSHYDELFDMLEYRFNGDDDAMEKERKRLEDQQAMEIAAIKEKYAAKTKVETQQSKVLSQSQYDYLKSHYDSLTKKEQEYIGVEYDLLNDEAQKALLKRYNKLMASDKKQLDKMYNEELKALERANRDEENALKQSLVNREITQAEYNAKIKVLSMKLLQQKIELAKQYGKDETQFVSKLLDEEIKLIGDATEEIGEMVNSSLKPKDGDIVDEKAYEDFWGKIESKAADIRADIAENSARLEYETNVKWAEALARKKIITNEEAEKYIFQQKLKYAAKAAEQVSAISEKASNFVTALKEAEAAQLEAQYQADLTAAGDNAEKKAEIEAQYEEDKLELSKKYADTEMVINIAKTIAAGALAAIQAFAQLGPIAGGVMAAIIAATTAAEVYTIVQQRNAIKNSSVSSSGSSSSSVQTGTRTMTGYAEGGYTENHTTITTVGEKGTEWVAPHWMVKGNPVMFANLEQYRKAGSNGRSGSVAKGFADGGFTSNGGEEMPAVSQNDILAAIREGAKEGVKEGLYGEYIRAYLVRRDLTEMDNQDERFKNQTSR